MKLLDLDLDMLCAIVRECSRYQPFVALVNKDFHHVVNVIHANAKPRKCSILPAFESVELLKIHLNTPSFRRLCVNNDVSTDEELDLANPLTIDWTEPARRHVLLRDSPLSILKVVYAGTFLLTQFPQLLEEVNFFMLFKRFDAVSHLLSLANQANRYKYGRTLMMRDKVKVEEVRLAHELGCFPPDSLARIRANNILTMQAATQQSGGSVVWWPNRPRTLPF